MYLGEYNIIDITLKLILPYKWQDHKETSENLCISIFHLIGTQLIQLFFQSMTFNFDFKVCIPQDTFGGINELKTENLFIKACYNMFEIPERFGDLRLVSF